MSEEPEPGANAGGDEISLIAKSYGSSQQFVTAKGDIYRQTVLGPVDEKPPPIDPPALKIPEVRGRDQIVEEILAAEGGSTWVLHGMGGGGKSTIAQQVAARYQAESRGDVYWVTDGVNLQQAMISIAEHREVDPDLVHRARLNGYDAHRLVWDSLATGRRWLLVFDNFDDPGALAGPSGDIGDRSGWLRSSPAGLVLITSRSGELWGPGTVPRRVGPLGPETGADVLTDLAPDAGPRADAVGLSDRLGGVPLALYLAGRYLASTRPKPHRTFEAYRHALDTELVDLIDRGERRIGAGDHRDARRRVRETWELSLRMLERDDDQGDHLARPVLRLLSCFGAPHPIRVDLLRAERLHGTFLDDGALTQNAIDEAVANLDLVSLLENTTVAARGGAELSCVTLHPLVSEVVSATVLTGTDQGEIWRAAQDCLFPATPDNPTDPQHWGRWAGLPAIHQAMLTALPAELTDELAAAVDAASLCALHLTATGSLQAGHDLTQLAVVRSGELPAAHPIRLSARLAATLVNRQDGAPAQLAGELRTLLAEVEQHAPAHSPQVTVIRQNLGSALLELQQFDEAAEQFEAITSACREAGVAVPIGVRFGYGQLYLQQGEFTLAETELSAVLAHESAEYGPEHPDTLVTRTVMASVSFGLGRVAEAQRELESVLAAQKRLFGADSPVTLPTRQTLFYVLATRGDAGAARHHLGEVVKIQRDSLNPAHPLALMGLATLASFQSSMDEDADHEVAVRRIREVGGVMARSLGDDHALVLLTRIQAVPHEWAFDAASAERECAELIRLNLRAVGPNHPATLEAMLLHGLIVADRDTVDGETELRELHTRLRNAYGTDHPHTIQVLHSLAHTTFQNGSPRDSETFMRDALASSIRFNGEDHAITQQSRAVLVDVLVELDKAAEAEQELLALIVSVQRTEGPTSEEVLGVRLMHALLCAALERVTEAEREFRDVLAILKREYPDDIGGPIVEGLLGELLHQTGNLAGAEPHLRAALAGLEAGLGPTDSDTLAIRLAIGELLHDRRQLGAAEEQLQIAMARLTENGQEPELAGRARAALAAVSQELQVAGIPAEPAVPEQPRVVEPAESPRVVESTPWHRLLTGGVRGAEREELLGRLNLAEPAPAVEPAILGAPPESVDIEPAAAPLPEPVVRRVVVPGPGLAAQLDTALSLLDQGFPRAARAGLAAALAAVGADETELGLRVRLELGRLRLMRGDAAGAARELRLVVSAAGRALGEAHELTVRASAWHALATLSQGEAATVRRLRELLTPRLAEVRLELAALLRAQGEPEAALHECITVLSEVDGRTPVALRGSATAAAIRGDAEGLERVLHAQVTMRGRFHPEVAETRHHLGVILAGAGEHARAARQLRLALAARRHRLGERHPATAATSAALAGVPG